ncbi:MAG: pyridoxal phosphate-dependent aminotransferase [Pseudomonadota bacterium]|nr:pyridoxal phosphate-dependent aminotransferase [Pseudomonadota bacterium]
MKYSTLLENLTHLGSEKWSLHYLAREKVASGTEVIELTIGEPDVPVDESLIEECYNSMRAGRTRYSNGRGEKNLLDQITNRYNKRNTLKISNENIVCFPGTQTALYAAVLSLVEKGGAVAVGDPMYATYEGVIRASGASITPVPLYLENDFIMQPRDLEKVLTPNTRVLILNSPHNPTGSVMSEQDFEKLSALCSDYDLWVISDEVYEELIFHGDFFSPRNIADLSKRTITVSSISKSHAAPGFRSGWAIGPKDFCKKILPLAETMLFGNQPFIADMTALALSKPSKVAAKMRADYFRRAELVRKEFRGVPSLKTVMPKAGMFLLVDISQTGLSCFNFSHKLLQKHNVAVMPGDSFGAQAKNYIRISLTNPDAILKEACKRISSFVNQTDHTKLNRG